jgi:hypothetical protein
MVEVQLHERTQALLNEPTLGNQDVDAKVRSLLEAEYLRQMARFRRVDQALSQKYGLSFDEFIEQRITERHRYVWEVEQDAMDWETAIGGIATMRRKLDELREIANEPQA